MRKASRSGALVMETAGMENTSVTLTSTIPFTLKLPTELDIKPKWSVPVSKNYTAKVFEELISPGAYEDGRDKPAVPHYRITLAHNQTGLAPRGVADHMNYAWGNNRGYRFTQLLDVRMALEDIARQMQPKSKTTTVTQANEEY